jgi:hypothetical protein
MTYTVAFYVMPGVSLYTFRLGAGGGSTGTVVLGMIFLVAVFLTAVNVAYNKVRELRYVRDRPSDRRAYRWMVPDGHWEAGLPGVPLQYMYTDVIGAYRYDSRYSLLFTLLHIFGVSIVASFDPSPSSCGAQFYALAGLQCVAATFYALRRPFRGVAMNLLNVMSNVLFAVVAMVAAAHADSTTTTTGLVFAAFGLAQVCVVCARTVYSVLQFGVEWWLDICRRSPARSFAAMSRDGLAGHFLAPTESPEFVESLTADVSLVDVHKEGTMKKEVEEDAEL